MRPRNRSIFAVAHTKTTLGGGVGLLFLISWMTAGSTASYADWQRQVWKASELADPNISDRSADPDGDNLPNLAEYLLGNDPTRPDKLRRPRMSEEATPSNPGWEFHFKTYNEARDAQVKVEYTESLGPNPVWIPLESGAAELRLVDSGASTQEYEVLLSPTSAVQLARLNVEGVEAPPTVPAYVWWEAETAGGESHELLSNNRMTWASPGRELSYPLDVPRDGTYTLWIRKFWNPQECRWRVGSSSDWTGIPRISTLVDLVELGPGRKVGWFNAGTADLIAGSTTFELTVPGNAADTTAYDCFLLTQQPFTPQGELKPNQSISVSEPGWFAFEPTIDIFTYSPIDLRFLNETEAGAHGFITVEGEDFVRGGDRAPIRFWAINVGSAMANLAKSEIDLFARTQAKRGVNLVRYHGTVYRSSGPEFGSIDADKIDRLHYLVKALKREGIYTALSIYFPLWVRLGGDNINLPGYSGDNPFALLYFNEPFQQIYRGWWNHLLRAPNPHTGLPLKSDPAVAMIEMVNEDSTLFWTFNPQEGDSGNIPDAQRNQLEAQFAEWLTQKYPGLSLEQIRSQKWQGTAVAQDDFSAGRVGFRSLWEIANFRTRRDQDTSQFLTHLMTRFYSETYRFVKQEIGYPGLVYASNWKTASAQYLEPLDKLANTEADFLDRHGYFGGLHQGADSSWAISPGQTYDDRAAVRFDPATGDEPDFSNPVFDLIYQGRPSTITEINWPRPNRFRSDMLFVGAAYGALQGTDALFWFAANTPTWENIPGKFSIQTPAVQGQFPAAALVYRKGLVKTAPRVVDLELAIDDLYALKGTPLPAPQNFDDLRGNDIPPGSTLTNTAAIDSLAFLVGRVGVQFLASGQPQSSVLDLSPYLDRPNQKVVSHTGELTWDYGRGIVTMDSPFAQGAAGFLGEVGPLALQTMTVTSELPYGSIWLVTLDDLPLSTSRKMLLQVMSEEKPYQWETDAETGVRTIINIGQGPMLVREISGTVQYQGEAGNQLTVTPLDANGYRVEGEGQTGSEIVLRKDRLYYLVEK